MNFTSWNEWRNLLFIQFYLLTGALSWLPSEGRISLLGRYFFIKVTILSRIYSCQRIRAVYIAITQVNHYLLPLPGLLWTGSIHCEVASLQSSTPSQTELGMEPLHNELWTLTFELPRGSRLAVISQVYCNHFLISKKLCSNHFFLSSRSHNLWRPKEQIIATPL